MHAGLVRRQHACRTRSTARRARKSPTSCAGRVVVAAAELERARFPVALEGDAGERVTAPSRGRPPVVLRRDADDDAGVGVALVARVLAHAVGDDAARLRGGRDHGAARAHAEAVDRAAVAARGAPACSRRRRAAGGRRSGRSARGRSATAGARCESRSRTAWPRGSTPRSCSISKVSRALWPIASTTWSARELLAASRAPRRARWPVLDLAGRSTRWLEADLAAQRLDRRRASSRPCRPAGRCRCAAC